MIVPGGKTERLNTAKVWFIKLKVQEGFATKDASTNGSIPPRYRTPLLQIGARKATYT